MKLTVPSVAFLLSLPLAANAQLIRCTSADGKSSTLQRGKCASATDVQTPVVAAKPIAVKLTVSLSDGLDAYEAGNYDTAFQGFQAGASAGDPLAQLLLGDLYHHGRGVQKDDTAAYTWTAKAAEQGHAKAQAALGVFHQEGWGTPQDDAKAAAWFRKAADQGYDTAQIALGFVYLDGRGVPKDTAQGLAWIRKAANSGNADAKSILAQLTR